MAARSSGRVSSDKAVGQRSAIRRTENVRDNRSNTGRGALVSGESAEAGAPRGRKESLKALRVGGQEVGRRCSPRYLRWGSPRVVRPPTPRPRTPRTHRPPGEPAAGLGDPDHERASKSPSRPAHRRHRPRQRRGSPGWDQRGYVNDGNTLVRAADLCGGPVHQAMPCRRRRHTSKQPATIAGHYRDRVDYRQVIAGIAWNRNLPSACRWRPSGSDLGIRRLPAVWEPPLWTVL